ncbi:PEP-CTERM/exosortase system-associated acyltransferase [Methylolobus aquaticus]|nr:PEP-CTERM/exosortase system-associated acyltransferase [Methylolobus aquaticus]
MVKSIDEAFNDYFEIVPATSPELKNEVYRLRYQVYCLETGFENPDDYPDGLERDEYDESSIHSLIRHRSTGLYAATTRLILPDPSNPDRPFPIERYAKVALPGSVGKIDRMHLSEISRFCVSKEFKRRRGEQGSATGLNDQNFNEWFATPDERRAFPHITLALMACITRMSAQYGLSHWFGLMEAPLIRMVALLGIYWTAIGPPVEHHGRRLPCIMPFPDFLAPVAEKSPETLELLSDHGRFWPPRVPQHQASVWH